VRAHAIWLGAFLATFWIGVAWLLAWALARLTTQSKRGRPMNRRTALRERRSRIYWPVIGGALTTILLAFPLAALSALLFRFPIPFASYESGWSAMPHALAAVRFYGTLGGFVLLALLGGLGGAVAHRLGKADMRRVWRWTVSLAAAVAFCAVMLLATLDYIIGPW